MVGAAAAAAAAATRRCGKLKRFGRRSGPGTFFLSGGRPVDESGVCVCVWEREPSAVGGKGREEKGVFYRQPK